MCLRGQVRRGRRKTETGREWGGGGGGVGKRR